MNGLLQPRRAGLVLAALLVAGPVRASETLAIQGGTLLQPDGTVLEDAVIVIEGGRITAVGAGAEVPFDATVVDAEGKVLFPGMILAHTSGGLDRANENVPVTPYVNVYDSLDPSSVFFEDSLRGGVTTLHVMQGDETVIGGLSRIVRPVGAMVQDMTVRPDVALKVSITPKNGNNRMTQMAALRKAFSDLEQHVEQVAERRYGEERDKEGEEVLVPPAEAIEEGRALVRVEDLESRWRTLYRMQQGQLPVYLNCERATDVLTGLEFMKSLGLLEQTVLVTGPETCKVVDAIAASGRPVILSGQLIYRETDPLTGEESETFVPRVFADAGVKFALQTGTGSMGEAQLWFQAARLVGEGVARETALASITQWPADIIGLGDEMGSVAEGKLGNVVVLSGDPLAQATVVESVVIDGQVVYRRDEDRRLKELLIGEEVPQPEETGDP